MGWSTVAAAEHPSWIRQAVPRSTTGGNKDWDFYLITPDNFRLRSGKDVERYVAGFWDGLNKGDYETLLASCDDEKCIVTSTMNGSGARHVPRVWEPGGARTPGASTPSNKRSADEMGASASNPKPPKAARAAEGESSAAKGERGSAAKKEPKKKDTAKKESVPLPKIDLKPTTNKALHRMAIPQHPRIVECQGSSQPVISLHQKRTRLADVRVTHFIGSDLRDAMPATLAVFQRTSWQAVEDYAINPFLAYQRNSEIDLPVMSVMLCCASVIPEAAPSKAEGGKAEAGPTSSSSSSAAGPEALYMFLNTLVSRERNGFVQTDDGNMQAYIIPRSGLAHSKLWGMFAAAQRNGPIVTQGGAAPPLHLTDVPATEVPAIPGPEGYDPPVAADIYIMFILRKIGLCTLRSHPPSANQQAAAPPPAPVPVGLPAEPVAPGWAALPAPAQADASSPSAAAAQDPDPAEDPAP